VRVAPENHRPNLDLVLVLDVVLVFDGATRGRSRSGPRLKWRSRSLET